MKVMIETFTPKLAKFGFCSALLAITILSLLPGDIDLPGSVWSDKISHFLAYFVVGVLYLTAYSNSTRAIVWGLVALVCWGGLIELTQGFPVIGRNGDAMDLLANGTGVVAAFVLYLGFRWVWQRF